MREQVQHLYDIVTSQRVVILQFTENENRLHRLIDIEKGKTHDAEIALHGDAVSDSHTLDEEYAF